VHGTREDGSAAEPPTAGSGDPKPGTPEMPGPSGTDRSSQAAGSGAPSGPAGPSGPSGLLDGLRLAVAGLSLLARHRRLWPLAAAPVALSLAFVAAAVSALAAFAPELYAWLVGWLPRPEASAWWEWLWVGPATVLRAALGGLLFAVVAALGVLAGLLAANVASAPFLDALSQQVERLERGVSPEPAAGGLRGLVRENLRSVANELRRVGFFAALWGAIMLAGLLVPGGQLLAPPLLALVSLLFLPLDYSGFALDRRQVPFRERRRWVLANLPLMVGFGGAAFATLLVPGLNLLVLPALVAGGTLLALRRPPVPAQPGRST